MNLLRPNPLAIAPIENRFLNRAESAALLGIGKRTLSRLIADRKLTFLKIGTRLLFDQADLRAYASSCKVKGGKP